MGRDLNWYVIPRDYKHDTSKQMCLNWEFQGDEEDVNNEIYEKATSESSQFDYMRVEGETHHEYFNRRDAFHAKVKDVVYDYKWEKSHKEEWCPTCLMFARGMYDNAMIIADEHIGHSYSNPCWSSAWNIKDLYLGSSHTSFVKLFRNDNMYREITQDDVEHAVKSIQELGKPLRNSDIETCEETMRVLEFLKKWTADPKVIVIMEDEC
jgi:hypothetical protein